MSAIHRRFQNPTVPQEYRANFIHLYADMGWFGLLSGSALNFLTVYAARLGANGFQIGLLGAISAVVNLAFAIPAMQLLQQQPIGKMVFWNSVIYRVGYLLWILVPFFFSNQGQIWALVSVVFLMGVPLTIYTVGFNALFAAAVPDEWRAYVAGTRNVVYSITYILAALGSGWLLSHLTFRIGYQVVFGIGAFGAFMSSIHLFFIRTRPVAAAASPAPQKQPTVSSGKPALVRAWTSSLRTDIWRTPFAAVLLVMLGLHLTQYLAIPLFPLYSVNSMHLTDQSIGIGTALYYLCCLAGSTQLHRFDRRLGPHKLTGLGFLVMSLYPFLLGFAHSATAYFIISAIGGFSWSLVGGAYANYILKNIPEHDRPAHLAWYNIILNAAILVGSLLGPSVAHYLGLGLALVLIGVCRFLAGLAILKWGQPAQLRVDPPLHG
ncbi:MAG: MFS transporter [Anaerolineales bacterium]|jgi:MFS family permease